MANGTDVSDHNLSDSPFKFQCDSTAVMVEPGTVISITSSNDVICFTVRDSMFQKLHKFQ